MKKTLALILTVIMVMTMAGTGFASADDASAELTPIKVAVMPMLISAPVYYAVETGLDEQYGLDVEMVLFSSGATMNEALASNEFDVAPIGGAGIFGVANYDGIYIADYQFMYGGVEIYAQKGDPALEIKGSNPTYPDLCGDADSVRGKTLLYTPGTTSQLIALKWLTALGLTSDDVNMLGMEYAQALQAFEAGQADYASMCSPYIYTAAADGYEPVASYTSLGFTAVQSIMATRKAYENKKDDLAKFVNMIYEANRQMMEDENVYHQWVYDWYKVNGSEQDMENIKRECSVKAFVHWDNMNEVEYGAYHKEYAEFFVSIGQLTEDRIDRVAANTVSDILELAKESK